MSTRVSSTPSSRMFYKSWSRVVPAIVTVIAGEGAPIPLAEIDTHAPDGVEIETHEGGQPSWWWLLAAQ